MENRDVPMDNFREKIVEEIIKEDLIEKLTIDLDNLTKDQLLKFETKYQILRRLHWIHLFTGDFTINADVIFNLYMPDEWHKKRPQGMFLKAFNEIMAYVNTKDKLLKTTAVVIHLLENINKVLRKVDDTFEKYYFMSLYLQTYKTFAELMLFDLMLLLHNAGGIKYFYESEEFVEKWIRKYFKLCNDPAELFFAFDDLADVLVQLTRKVLDEEWERFKEEVCKHGGFIKDEKPNN